MVFVVVQLSVAGWPDVMVLGVTEKLSIAGRTGGAEFTVTVKLVLAVPPAPIATSV